MNFPGRAKTKVPLDAFDTFRLPSIFLTRRWVNSPLAAWVLATKDWNWSSADASASDGNSAASVTAVAVRDSQRRRRGSVAMALVAASFLFTVGFLTFIRHSWLG